MPVFNPWHWLICILSSHASSFRGCPASGLCVCSASPSSWDHALSKENYFKRKEGLAVGYLPPGLRKAYSHILSPTHRFSWMTCANLLSQGTGKTLWKLPKDGLVHLDLSLGGFQRPNISPTYLPFSTHHDLWAHSASTINFHSTLQGGRRTDHRHGCRPITACCWEAKSSSPLIPPTKLEILVPCSAPQPPPYSSCRRLSLRSQFLTTPQSTNSLKQQKKHWAISSPGLLFCIFHTARQLEGVRSTSHKEAARISSSVASCKTVQHVLLSLELLYLELQGKHCSNLNRFH